MKKLFLLFLLIAGKSMGQNLTDSDLDKTLSHPLAYFPLAYYHLGKPEYTTEKIKVIIQYVASEDGRVDSAPAYELAMWLDVLPADIYPRSTSRTVSGYQTKDQQAIDPKRVITSIPFEWK